MKRISVFCGLLAIAVVFAAASEASARAYSSGVLTPPPPAFSQPQVGFYSVNFSSLSGYGNLTISSGVLEVAEPFYNGVDFESGQTFSAPTLPSPNTGGVNVPEPTTGFLGLAAVGGLLALRRPRRSR